jgi:hypothetical protein
VVEQVGEPNLSGKTQREMSAAAPVRERGIERKRLDGDGVAERLEQAPHKVLAAAGRDGRQRGLQRHGGGRQLGPLFACAGHRALEDVDHGD